ncbi:MAG: C39 family peptidase [Patescibacteria group bacterium]
MLQKQFQRVGQMDDSTCGPAVMQMLLDYYGIAVTQKDVVHAAGADATVEEEGTRIDQLSTALRQLAPNYALWYKEDASIEDMVSLIDEHQVPVVVNWQGLFYDTLKEEAKLSTAVTHGHYSLITDVNVQNDTITMVDPFYEFVEKDRIFPIDWFKSRWWDVDYKTDAATHQDIAYYTSRLLFIVVPAKETFPKKVGMTQVPTNYLQQKFEKARLSHSHHPPLEPKNRIQFLWNYILNFRKVMKEGGELSR